MNGFVWLASYPKSGNTWFRVFLSNLLTHADEPVNINDLLTMTIASKRLVFDEAVGIEASDLTESEIDLLRPEVYAKWAQETQELQFHKIHDAFRFLENGRPLVPFIHGVKVLYFIRNPLDVAVSYANHTGQDINKTIVNMGDNNYFIGRNSDRCNLQFRQILFSWSEHVRSWIDRSEIPLHVIRYEDMKNNTMDTFKTAVQFLKLDYTDDKILKAIEFSEFDRLKSQEQTYGFRERAPACASFFNKGKSGVWRESLTDMQIQQIIDDHRAIMKRFGYLNEYDEIPLQGLKS